MSSVKKIDWQQTAAGPKLIQWVAVLGWLLAAPMVQAQYALEDPTRPGHWQENQPSATARVAEPALTLDSILLSPHRRVAIISGRLMSEGESRDGVKLLKVGEREVTVSKNGKQRKLTLKPVVDLRR